MWTKPSRSLPAEGELVVACYDGCSPWLAKQEGGRWYVCTVSGKVKCELEDEPDWWIHKPWKVPATEMPWPPVKMPN